MTAPAYRHTEDMGEISGFGGGYEETCQKMLEAGVIWLSQHPNADLRGHEFAGITGIFTPESDDAKEMEKAAMEACNNDCSGAMHHTVMSRLFYIAANGWTKYCEELRKRKAERDAEPPPQPIPPRGRTAEENIDWAVYSMEMKGAELEVEFNVGIHINSAIRALFDLHQKKGFVVRGSFNGYTIRCTAQSTIDSLTKEWNDHINHKE